MFANFYVMRISALILILLPELLYAQCTVGVAGSTTTPTSSTFNSVSIGPGLYYTFNVESGKLYSFRTSGGGNWTNPYITLTNTGNGVLDYNDNNGPYYSDYCSGTVYYASLDWLSTFNGSVRVHVTRDGCAGWFSGNNSAVLEYREVVQPADNFGNNRWTVYAYNENDISLSSGQGRFGYYDGGTSLGINTFSQWSGQPSSASGWTGAPEVPNDLHTIVGKRQGFPTGCYNISMLNHDDGAVVYVNGVQVFIHDGGCCDNHGVVWTGHLDATSTVEIRSEEGCGGTGFNVDISAINTGDPSVFGNNQWNVYCYEGTDYNLGPGATYYGYYVETNFSYDSRNRWCSGCSPASASGYVGCDPGIDYHTVVSKRKGVPCGYGYYRIDVPNHDDNAKLFIDGVQVWVHDGCCDSHTGVWTGYLDSNSEIEFRHMEGVGGSHQGLTFTLVNPPSTPFGNNEWLVHVYDGNDYNLGSVTYYGYYTETNLTYNSLNRWCSTCTPANASGYIGCDPGVDTHTLSSKRKGVPCGYYTIDVTNHDDASRLIINGTTVWDHSGCCDSHSNVWSGYLGVNDELEMRHGEGGGGSHQGLQFNFTALAGGTASSSHTICSGNTPSNITLSGHFGATIQWQRANNSAFTSGVTNVGTNSTTLTGAQAGTLTATRYFRAAVSGGSCPAVYSNVITVTVDATSAVGAVSGNQTICTGSQPSNMTIASATGTIQWERANDAGFSSGLTNVGTNSTTLTGAQAGTLTATRYFRARVTNGVCPAVYSSTITVTVNQNPTTASAGSNLTRCLTQTATLSANTPGVGTGVWSVVSGPSTSLSQFSSTSNPSAVFTPAGGTGNYVLRWTISNSPCAASTSDVTISIIGTQSSSTWNGSVSTDWFNHDNWGGCVPGSITDATIPSSTGTGNFPIITTGGAGECRTITLQGTVTDQLRITGTGTLQIHVP